MQSDIPIPDAQQRLERLLAARGYSLEKELEAFDGEGEPSFPGVNEMIDSVLGDGDDIDRAALEQMRKKWQPLTQPRQTGPDDFRFVPDQQR